MKAIKRFTGDWDKDFGWEGTRTRLYQKTEDNQVSETWMIGKAEGAQNFAFRYYLLSQGSHSREEQHPYDHGLLILHGEGEVLLEDQWHKVSRGDIVYIKPDLLHQVKNTSEESLGFICVIPARRQKAGGIVWAEEGINFD